MGGGEKTGVGAEFTFPKNFFRNFFFLISFTYSFIYLFSFVFGVSFALYCIIMYQLVHFYLCKKIMRCRANFTILYLFAYFVTMYYICVCFLNLFIMLLFILSCFLVLLLIVYKYLDDKIDENELHELAFGYPLFDIRILECLRSMCVVFCWFVIIIFIISLF